MSKLQSLGGKPQRGGSGMLAVQRKKRALVKSIRGTSSKQESLVTSTYKKDPGVPFDIVDHATRLPTILETDDKALVEISSALDDSRWKLDELQAAIDDDPSSTTAEMLKSIQTKQRQLEKLFGRLQEDLQEHADLLVKHGRALEYLEMSYGTFTRNTVYADTEYVGMVQGHGAFVLRPSETRL